MEIKTVSLNAYSSLRIGGAGKLSEVASVAQLIEVLKYAQANHLRVHIVGAGTNTYFGESLDTLLLIKISHIGITCEEKEDSAYLTVQAGEIWDDVVKFSVEKQLWGIENLSYIPGTMGAAPIQNIGAYGTELADVFVSLSALDTRTLSEVEINKSGCNFGYRDSFFKQSPGRYIIHSVRLVLSKVKKPVLTYKPLDTLQNKIDITVEEVRNLVIATRTGKIPSYSDYPNAGSFFKNPIVDNLQAQALLLQYHDIKLIEQEGRYKISAAWLIEHVAHMKGVRVGDIGTWPDQPLVIVNYGKASAAEINRFSEEIVKKIYEKTGITLEREVNYVGNEKM